MTEKQRKPQIINGEMFPSNFFIGRESCKSLEALISAFKQEGINLHAIPIISTIEQKLQNEELEPGTVLGCREPHAQGDIPSVLVWDGSGISAISFMIYHKYQERGWTWEKREAYAANQTDYVTPVVEKKKKKKKKKTTTKHEQQRKRKARNGRRV